MIEAINIIAKGSSGGSRSSSTSRSTSTSTSKTSTSSTSSKTSTSTAPKTSSKSGTSKSKAGSKVKTSSGKEVQSSAKKPANSKYSRETGIVGENGYTPRFSNGYSAPEGSVVYYPQHSALDYLPWIYLFSQDHSSRNDQATVVQPDNKEVVAAPERSGMDGLLIFNWIILVLLAAAFCAGIVWLVNKLTRRNK